MTAVATTVAGPLAGAFSNLAEAPPGCVQEQYLVSGRVGADSYCTIIQIVRPVDDASGIVVVEPWHRAGYWTIYDKVAPYLTRRRHTAAIVLANAAVAETYIKPKNPTFYDRLSIPDTPTADSEILAQAAALLRLQGLPRLSLRRMILAGHSTEGAWVRRYIAQQHAQARLDGRPLYDGYFPTAAAIPTVQGPLPDLDVPVIELQGECEMLRYFGGRTQRGLAYRRDDGPLYRLYEVPGMPHVPTRNGMSAERVAELRDFTSPNWSNFPMCEVFNAALENLIAWVDHDAAAPHAPRIPTSADGRMIARDEHGNASGGLRTTYLDVPTVTVHATNGPFDVQNGPRADFFAWDQPFGVDKLKRLYPTHADYVRKVEASLESLVAGRWYLAEDAAEFRAEASAAQIP